MSAAAESAAGPETWIGRTLDDRYRLERVLGQGGMGAVFAAHHLRLDKKVAVKIIQPELAGDGEMAKRFAREAMITAKLEHPHVVSAIDTGELPGGGAYLVMQLAPGRSLKALLRARPSWQLACHVGAQIADALSSAHAAGIVHRDLKPDNVIVEERDGEVHARVLDFGIARAGAAGANEGAAGQQLTRLGTVLGTPGYMPPEQGLGDTVDHRADLYSLGVVLWETSMGRPLFGGKDLREIALAQLTEPVPALEGEGLPAGLQELVDALLQPKREDRPDAAAEVREKLREMSLAGRTPTGRIALPGARALPASPFGASARAVGGEGTPASGLRAAGASQAFDTPAHAPTMLSDPGASPKTRMLTSDAVGSRAERGGGGTSRGAIGAVVIAALLLGALVVAGIALGGSGLDLSDVPEALRADVETLVLGDDATARVGAAARLDRSRDALPPFAAHLADYELARDCEHRRHAVRDLRHDEDARAVPALRRMAALPATGCGGRGTEDCHACMRHDVSDALRRLDPDGAPIAPAAGASGAPSAADPGADEAADEPRGHGRGRGHRR